MRIEWDDVNGDRGWAYLTAGHPCPDRPGNCGWYLDYSETGSRGPDGAPVLWRAYLFVTEPRTRMFRTIELGCGWEWTHAEAKATVGRLVGNCLETQASELATA